MMELTELAWATLSICGRDAFSFSQGQFSQEISEQPRASLLLAPDGHVVVGGSVRAVGDDVEFVVPASLADVTRARLQRFILRVDVTLSIRVDANGPFRDVNQLFEDRWPSEWEWQLALPPHSYGQWVVDAAVSFSKGCFTGQELVGRADARGATMPWRFVGGTSDDLSIVEESLQAIGPDGPKGVTSYIRSDDTFRWRGVAHRTWTPPTESSVLEFMA